jgi:hypothetical protein
MIFFEAGKPVGEHCILNVPRLFRNEALKCNIMLMKLYTESKKWKEIS